MDDVESFPLLDEGDSVKTTADDVEEVEVDYLVKG